MLTPTAKQILLYAGLHLVASAVLWTAATALGLDFSREPSLWVDAVAAFAVILVYPVIAIFDPLFSAVLPPMPSVVLAALVNSLLWGLVIAYVVNAVRRRKAA